MLHRPCRGSYTLVRQELLLEDFCGFFRRHIQGAKGGTVLIYPGPGGSLKSPVSSQSSAPEREVLYTAMKNQDYFESRPYYPGDDPRRINWKMMARHGELFIREGSACLPSRNRVLLVLDPGNDVLRHGYLVSSDSPGDQLIRQCAALIEHLKHEGCCIDLVGPGTGVMTGLESCSELELQNRLALVPPQALREEDLSELRISADVLYLLCTAMPDQRVLDLSDSISGDRSRKVLVVTEGNPGHGQERKRKKITDQAIPEQPEGWTLVRP